MYVQGMYNRKVCTIGSIGELAWRIKIKLYLWKDLGISKSKWIIGELAGKVQAMVIFMKRFGDK